MSGSPGRPSDRIDEVLALFARGAEFTHRLIAENQRLRERVSEPSAISADDLLAWEKLRPELLACLEGLRAAENDMLERLVGAQEESLLFAQRCRDVETENDHLAALYVAGHQLHSTLDLGQVFKIIIEITLNLIGARRVAIFLLDEQTRRLEAVAAEGVSLEALPQPVLGEAGNPLGAALHSGEIVCPDPVPSGDPARPLVAIPMRVDDRPIGVIAIYRFLEHKEGISVLDRELFTLLAAHSATAIFAARLYSASKRKLNTIQGFIDLLTK